MDGQLSGRRLQVTLAVAGAVAFILQGYDQALMNGLLTLPAFVRQFPSIDTSTPELDEKNSTLQGTAVALYEVGAALGALSCFFVGDRYGRKMTTLGAAVVVLVGVILQSTTYSVAQLIVARIWTGLGVGAFTATIPTWVGESVSAHDRGRFVMLEGSMAIFGVAFIAWVEFGFYFVGENPVSWRFPIAFQALFAIAVLMTLPFLTESPRWLISKDRHAEAAEVLSRLEGKDVDSEEVNHKMSVIAAAVRLDSGEGHTKNPFARTPVRHLNRTLLAISINIFGQMSGINIITFYSNTIFEGVLGFSGVESRVITGCLQVWQFIWATSAVFFIERFGRRGLLLFAAGGMAVAHSGLAGLQAHVGNKGAAGASLLFYFIALAVFPVGYFLIPFMYASEIAPLPVRARVTALSTATNWLFNFMIAEITPKAFADISWKYYLVYLCCNVFAFVCIYLFAPETRGRTLEDIDAIFLESSNAFQPVKVAKLLPAGVAEEFNSMEKGAPRGNHIEIAEPASQ